MKSARAGVVEVTQRLDTVALLGDGPVWKTNLGHGEGLGAGQP